MCGSHFIYFIAAPSKPHRLSFVPQPPSQVDLNWAEPLTPNGIIRHYIVHYWRQDGTGNRTAVGPVEGLNVSLLNLTPSTVYNVSVQAYTVGYGPAASIDVISHSISKPGVYSHGQRAFEHHLCIFKDPLPLRM